MIKTLTSHLRWTREDLRAGENVVCFWSVAQRSGVLIHRGAWAEDQQWRRLSAKWSDQSWEPAHPSVLWGKPLAFPGFPQRMQMWPESIYKRGKEALQLGQRENQQWCRRREQGQVPQMHWGRGQYGTESTRYPSSWSPETCITPGRQKQNRS